MPNFIYVLFNPFFVSTLHYTSKKQAVKALNRYRRGTSQQASQQWRFQRLPLGKTWVHS